jgi:DNA-binding transcriptional regulator GbsR (MarR family)
LFTFLWTAEIKYIVVESINMAVDESTGTELPAQVWREPMIGFFSQVAQFLGIPPSVGQVYGTLFTSQKPLSQEELMEALGLSKAGVSKALDYLRRYEAVRQVYQMGERRAFFEAELDLGKITTGFMNAQVERDFRSWQAQLEAGERLLDEGGDELRAMLPELAAERLRLLRRWFDATQAVLPVIKEHFNKRV